MKTVVNKTTKPLKVPLPRGKVLRLGPLKEGQISVHAVDHAPLAKLVEAGEIEIRDDGASAAQAGGDTAAPHEATHGHQPKAVHKSGDR